MDAAHRHQSDPGVLHDFEPRVVFGLEPVDAVTVTTLMDNVTDVFMPDQGPARRPPTLAGRVPAARQRPLYAVMGGFHLNGPIFESLIPNTVGTRFHL